MRMSGLALGSESREMTFQPFALATLPMDLVPQKSSRTLIICIREVAEKIDIGFCV